MSRTFNCDRAASALVDALFVGDKEAAAKWDCSTRSIEEWRVRMKEDGDLLLAFNAKKRSREKTWAGDIPEAIASGLKFIKDATSHADPADPEAIKAITQAVKVLMDIDLTKQILDARLAAEE